MLLASTSVTPTPSSGLFEGEKLVHSWRIKTDARTTADELALMFRGLLAEVADDHRDRPVLDRAGGAARAAHDARPLLGPRAAR